MDTPHAPQPPATASHTASETGSHTASHIGSLTPLPEVSTLSSLPDLAPAVGPTGLRERIQALDLLRGFAVLGILLMNIQIFAMPLAAYSNPSIFGDLQGINLLVWVVGHLFFDVKFISLFSVLFGAGILLMLERAEARGVARPARLHLRRMGFLLLFGLVHAYLLWYGDILVTYAICGSVFFLLRGFSSRALLLGSGLLLGFQIVLWLFFGFSLPYWPEDARTEMLQSWAPSAELLAKEVAAYRAGWLTQLPARAEAAIFFQTGGLLMFSIWRVGGMMLLGMAMLKSGFLTGSWSVRRYAQCVLVLGPLGLGIIAWGAWRQFQEGWTLEYGMFVGSQWNLLGSIPLVVAYVALGVLVWKQQWIPAVSARLQAVGRMAFSNYILQTLLCTILFYGHGLGLFGYLERWQQALVVLSIWALILAISPVWLKRNGMGPLERVWRWGTYAQWRRAQSA